MLIAALAAILAMPAAAARDARPVVTVLAAASLADAMPKLAAAWPGSARARVSFDFDASSRLARQIEQGLEADVFASADEDWMDYAARRGLIEPKTRRVVAGNALVAVAPAASAARASSPRELLDPAWRRLALAGETVPAGKYARQALTRLGLWEALSGRVVRGQDVRSTLHWAAVGEVDAAVVYATDAAAEPKVRVLFVFPPGSHEPIVYPAAVLAGAPQPGLARSFLDFCASAAAAPIWKAAGFSAAGAR